MQSAAEEANALHSDQSGCCKRRTPKHNLFLNRLSRDLIHQLRMNGAFLDNDAIGCFDRILVSMGMIACRRLGMPRSAIRSQAATLQHMRYVVKTVHGVSKDNYHGTLFAPLFGTGQGSGSSPAIWTAVSVILLNAFDQLVKEGFSFQDPWNQVSVHHKGQAFVDDTWRGLTVAPTTSYDDLVVKLETIAQTWERLLNISGGALNMSKCWWSIQFWEWDSRGRPFLRPHTTHDPDLVLTTSETGHQTTIRHSPNSEANRTLGV